MVLKSEISYTEKQKATYQHQCRWELTVNIGEEVKTVFYPLTVEFSIVRNTSAQANTAQFNIYNLAPSTRSSEFFFQDRFNTSKRKIVKFKAGYGDKLTEIFKGYILESYSKRQGADIVTQMQCLDLGNITDYVNQTFEGGTSYREIVETIGQTSKELTIDNIGSLDGRIETPTYFQGNVMQCINQVCGGNAFSDNGKVSILQPNEALDIGVTEINADTGLLNTPERRDGEVVIDSIFRPEIVVGQLLHIKSSTASEFDGTYKVCGITHSGVISGAQGGQRHTQFNLFIGAQLPNGDNCYTGQTQRQPFSKVKGKSNITPVNGKIGSDVYSVYKYIMSHNGQAPNTKVCEGITWRQLIYPGGTFNRPQDVKNNIKVEYLQNQKVIANKLRAFVDSNWGRKTITITSGYRTPQGNNRASSEGAKSNSAHLRGNAIDFNIHGVNGRYAFHIFNKKWDKFTYYMVKNGNIHVQSTYGAGGARRVKGQERW